MAGEKLTKVQREVPVEMEHAPQSYAPTYPPIRALLAKQMVDARESRWGNPVYSLTPAGRAALNRKEGGNG